MNSRCSSAVAVGKATLKGWRAVYDKPSTDGSAKLNIRRDTSEEVHGVIYEIDDAEREALDSAEPGYTPIIVMVEGERLLTYTYEGRPFNGPPFDWYVEMVEAGARHHGLEGFPG